MQLGLLRNNKLHVNISVLTDCHQAMCKILRKKITLQTAHISCENPHAFTMQLLLTALLNQSVFFTRLPIKTLQCIKSFSMRHEKTKYWHTKYMFKYRDKKHGTITKYKYIINRLKTWESSKILERQWQIKTHAWGNSEQVKFRDCMLRRGTECVYRLLSKTMHIKLYSIIIWPVLYAGWNMGSWIKERILVQCVREQGTERDTWAYRILRNKVSSLLFFQKIIRSSNTERWTRYVERMGDSPHAYKIFIVETEGRGHC
jgi:hypothetical protein